MDQKGIYRLLFIQHLFVIDKKCERVEREHLFVVSCFEKYAYEKATFRLPKKWGDLRFGMAVLYGHSLFKKRASLLLWKEFSFLEN